MRSIIVAWFLLTVGVMSTHPRSKSYLMLSEVALRVTASLKFRADLYFS